MRVWLVVVVSVVVLVGCAGGGSSVPSPVVVSSGVPSKKVSVSPSPTLFPSPSPSFDAEKQPIYDGLMRFLSMYDKLARDPTSMQPVDVPSVAINQAGVGLAQVVGDMVRDGWKRGGGPVTYHDIQIATPVTKNGVTQSEATYCKDLSAIKILRTDGTEESVPDRPRAQGEVVTLERMPDGSWMTSHVTNTRQESC